jgi:hypothetical protein
MGLAMAIFGPLCLGGWLGTPVGSTNQVFNRAADMGYEEMPSNCIMFPPMI